MSACAYLVNLTCVDCGLQHPCLFDDDPKIGPNTVWRCAVCFAVWFKNNVPFGVVDAQPLDEGRPVRLFR